MIRNPKNSTAIPIIVWRYRMSAKPTAKHSEPRHLFRRKKKAPVFFGPITNTRPARKSIYGLENNPVYVPKG
ncbi:hypothetical protein PSACC_00822 [Paramicrosporidium saccamoebae]|uniref:Uncharacterized protein n=1 Tax=Paramicrosporidium saccamoebae TaxID=1246581 RepID=A0A2H9TNL5_9FUNG|nr:hypothetical protein PSACC_00822 [Paramicrosporidium saccamoebae]